MLLKLAHGVIACVWVHLPAVLAKYREKKTLDGFKGNFQKANTGCTSTTDATAQMFFIAATLIENDVKLDVVVAETHPQHTDHVT